MFRVLGPPNRSPKLQTPVTSGSAIIRAPPLSPCSGWFPHPPPPSQRHAWSRPSPCVQILPRQLAGHVRLLRAVLHPPSQAQALCDMRRRALAQRKQHQCTLRWLSTVRFPGRSEFVHWDREREETEAGAQATQYRCRCKRERCSYSFCERQLRRAWVGREEVRFLRTAVRVQPVAASKSCVLRYSRNGNCRRTLLYCTSVTVGLPPHLSWIAHTTMPVSCL